MRPPGGHLRARLCALRDAVGAAGVQGARRRRTRCRRSSRRTRRRCPGLAGDIPPALQGIVSQCLEKRPEDRFSSAHDLALALHASSGTGAVTAPQPRRDASAAPPAAAAEPSSPSLRSWPLSRSGGRGGRLGTCRTATPERAPSILALPCKVYGAPEVAFLTDAVPQHDLDAARAGRRDRHQGAADELRGGEGQGRPGPDRRAVRGLVARRHVARPPRPGASRSTSSSSTRRRGRCAGASSTRARGRRTTTSLGRRPRGSAWRSSRPPPRSPPRWSRPRLSWPSGRASTS